MKKINYLLGVLLFTTLTLFVSCGGNKESKEDDPNIDELNMLNMSRK